MLDTEVTEVRTQFLSSKNSQSIGETEKHDCKCRVRSARQEICLKYRTGKEDGEAQAA